MRREVAAPIPCVLTVLLVPRILCALLVLVHFLSGVAATIWYRVSATTPWIADSSLVPIPIFVFAVVLVAIPIFGIVMAVIPRAHCLSTLIVELFTRESEFDSPIRRSR